MCAYARCVCTVRRSLLRSSQCCDVVRLCRLLPTDALASAYASAFAVDPLPTVYEHFDHLFVCSAIRGKLLAERQGSPRWKDE